MKKEHIVEMKSGHIILENLPDECPFCHRAIVPEIYRGYIHDIHLENRTAEVFFSCSSNKCLHAFVGYFEEQSDNLYTFLGTTKGTHREVDFDEIIESISPNFKVIYNEAFVAEQENLLQICGVGYRKALEFLIKDYTILMNADEDEEIKKMALGNCIKTFVDNDKIKKVAKRAVWLGNDETHYVRKWEGKDLQDLKKLIDLTVHWIEMEKLTESFEEEMPD